MPGGWEEFGGLVAIKFTGPSSRGGGSSPRLKAGKKVESRHLALLLLCTRGVVVVGVVVGVGVVGGGVEVVVVVAGHLHHISCTINT